jgi:hypothetical protein
VSAGKKSTVGIIALALLVGLACRAPASARADFGFDGLRVTAKNEDGSVDVQAGSRPYEYTVDFGLKLHEDAVKTPDGKLRTIIVKLPRGMVGNPRALPRCPRSSFDSVSGHCSPDTQVGVVHIAFVLNGLNDENLESPVYNLTTAPGRPASLGFNLDGIDTFQDASVRSSSDFGIDVSDFAIPAELEFQSVTETIWGVPADQAHDPERFCNGEVKGCSSGAQPAPFLTLPTSCGEPLVTTVELESLENPGVFVSRDATSEEVGVSPTLSDCGQLEFEPSISARPTTNRADSPTGLDFDLHQPQNEDYEGFSTAHLKDTTITLPRELTLNASAAAGLGSCSESQVGYAPSGGEIHFTDEAQSCPDAAKVGTLEVHTPPLDDGLGGAVYLAKPYLNPFGSLLAIYLVIEDERTGIIAKLAGKVSPDPDTGQLTTTFLENPQLPLEDVELHLFKGPRAALKTPLTCGRHATNSTLVPWSTPEGETVHPSDTFMTSVPAVGGSGCPVTAAQAPSVPGFSAGTLIPRAGTYSPFVLRVTRADGSQRIRSINTTLPKGLTGKLAGVAYCSEVQIAQAKSREVPNQGAVEQSSPSCPADSEVGAVTVGAGAGDAPYYVTGHAYLAGPYKGAPLSLVIVTPALAGPFDLGAVVVRTALEVDSETAQITAVSDPIPPILDGVPLDVRSIAIDVDRPNFSLNPTSCNPTQVLGTTTSTLGSLTSLASRFQVGGCKGLRFAPKLSLSLEGGTRRGKHPALRAVLTYPKGRYANTASARVTLPHGEFIDQAHFKTICTRVQFASERCPAGSVYGFARAITPLLDRPVEGPVYLRSSTHRLPDLVIALKGQVNADLVGRIDTGRNGGLRTTFERAPDVPVRKVLLRMQGGDKGLLQNSENICRKEQRALLHFRAQNGREANSSPLVGNDCKAKGVRQGKKKD